MVTQQARRRERVRRPIVPHKGSRARARALSLPLFVCVEQGRLARNHTRHSGGQCLDKRSPISLLA